MYSLSLRRALRLGTLSLRRNCRGATTMAAAQPLIHYDSFSQCPYAQRSWIALVEKKLPFEIKRVDLQDKPQDFKDLYATIHPDPEAPAKVPILIDGGTKLIESNIVVEYLAAKYAGQGESLLPEDPAAAAKARLFVELYGSLVSSTLYELLRADSAAAVAAGKEKLVRGLKLINEFLLRHGSSEGGDYLLGAQYSLAETCSTSFAQRLVVLLPHYRNIDVWGLLSEHKLERLERWYRAALARPSAKETAPTDELIIQGNAKFVSPLA